MFEGVLLAILVGIDEAGYGPVLGPLAVCATVFRLPDAQRENCLWERLRASCSISPRHAARKVIVCDSKKLHKPGKGIGALERTALVTLAAAGHTPQTMRAFLDLVAPSLSTLLDEYPWYRDADPALPLDPATGDVMTRANALRRDLRENGVTPVGVFGEVLLEGQYNDLVSRTRNKSIALLGLVLRLICRTAASTHERTVRIHVDRLGGRSRYRSPLMTSLPSHELTIIEETAQRSAYRLCNGSGTIEIAFVTKGDRNHFPIALASIFGKYIREMLMRCFNDYWSREDAGLRPTAGYYTDAQRWLSEAAPLIDRLGIDRSRLIRER